MLSDSHSKVLNVGFAFKGHYIVSQSILQTFVSGLSFYRFAFSREEKKNIGKRLKMHRKHGMFGYHSRVTIPSKLCPYVRSERVFSLNKKIYISLSNHSESLT